MSKYRKERGEEEKKKCSPYHVGMCMHFTSNRNAAIEKNCVIHSTDVIVQRNRSYCNSVRAVNSLLFSSNQSPLSPIFLSLSP